MHSTELAGRLARDAGFTTVKHSHGFTATRSGRNGQPLLLFCLGDPIQFEFRTDPRLRVIADGFGLAALAATLHGMRLLRPPMLRLTYQPVRP